MRQTRISPSANKLYLYINILISILVSNILAYRLGNMYRAVIASALLLATAPAYAVTASHNRNSSNSVQFQTEHSTQYTTQVRNLETFLSQNVEQAPEIKFKIPYIRGSEDDLYAATALSVETKHMKLAFSNSLTHQKSQTAIQYKVNASFAFENGTRFNLELDEKPNDRKVRASYKMRNGSELTAVVEDLQKNDRVMVSYSFPI